MTSSASVTSRASSAARPAEIRWHPTAARYAPVVAVVLALIAIWYVAAVLMNRNIVRNAFERDEIHYTSGDLTAGTLTAARPLLPAPHPLMQTVSDHVFR